MKKIIGNFSRKSDGNVVVIFALALLPVLLATGVAVDYARKSAASSQVQAVLDAAALAAARLPAGTSESEVQRYGEDYLRSHAFNEKLKINNVSIKRESLSVTATARSSIETSLMQVAGFDSLPFDNVARVEWQETPVEIALVIDVSSSMNDGGRLAAAREAAGQFIDDLGHIPGVKVSLTNYNHLVRIKPEVYRNSDWIEYDGPEWHMPVAANGAPPKPASKASWTGCLAEREIPNHTNVSGIAGTKYWAAQCSELTPVEELTADLALLRTKALGLEAGGYTNMTLGVSMGAATLAPDGPFPHTAAPYKAAEKHMVLLIDGGNTASRHRGMTDKGAPPQMNDDTLKLCSQVQKAGIIVHGLRLMTDEQVIKECSSPGYFQDITRPSDLKAAFNNVLLKIRAVRLTN